MSVRPKKRLGQHFLTDPHAVRAIVEAVKAPAGARVVEIGPGEGALTGDLLRRYPGLVAIEVDDEAVAHLRRRFPALDLRQQDVLATDWRALAGSGERQTANGGNAAPPGSPPLDAQRPFADPRSPLAPLYVVGNLPYYITSPILFALLDARAVVSRAVVMVQKEVADRLVAPPGSKVYGTLSVYFALYARAGLVLDVPRGAFHPPPKVESAVVALDFAGADPPGVPFDALQRVVRAAFGQRRKMLRNSLGPLAQAAGADLGPFATLRPEAVAPADFVALARLLHVAPPR